MTTSSPQTSSPAEFRRYRRFVAGFVLAFVTLGSAYLLVSVGVSIYRRRHALPNGEQVSAALSNPEIRSCYQELDDVRQELRKHLENFHHLIGGYDSAEAQRWEDEGAIWTGQWKALGKRCRFDEARGKSRAERSVFDQMAAAHEELGAIQQVYTQELLRFGRYQAPRLDRVRKRLEDIGARLMKAGPPAGESKP